MTQIGEERWQQVLTRDAHSDGKFVYGVRSTHIYCRPTCPSRRPRRSNVDFFAQPKAAEDAGFRACKRCLPASVHPQLQVIQAVCDYIEANLEKRTTLAAISRHMGFSPFHLQRSFRKVLGLSPLEYQFARRIDHFKRELHASRSIASAAFAAGYGSSSRLYEHANVYLGMKPTAYLRNGEGEQITYRVFDYAAGKLLIAVTPTGICRIQLGANKEELTVWLQSEFSAADIQHGKQELKEIAQSLLVFLESNVLASGLSQTTRATVLHHLACISFQSRPSR